METDPTRRYRNCLIGNYAQPPLALVRGEGSYVWDAQGRRYLDMGSGIAVNALGHAHPHWVRRVSAQAAKLVHCSNLYAIPAQAELAEKLCQYAADGKWLFCNSGTEANEALIKLARLYGIRKTGEEGKCYQVVTAEHGFHGRTFGGMSATPQAKIQKGFAPLLQGFKTARLNDIDSFRAAIDDTTAAVLVETIQGEGGIHVASSEFLRELRALCTERKVLLMIDEVQCGTGRTGTFFAYEAAGIRPDAIAMAKGLGGGLPIGAIWTAMPYSDLFTPGSHGTTFGGNPLVCTAALAVLEVLEQEKLMARVRTQGAAFREQLETLARRYPQAIQAVRGIGYMIGLVMQGDALAWNTHLRDHGMLAVPATGGVIRLLPPLTATQTELNEACQILEQTLKDHA